MNRLHDEWLTDEPRGVFSPSETSLPTSGIRRSGHEAADELTAREWEVIEHLTVGRCYKEIGEQLGIGIETVRTHLKRIYRKLGVKSALSAVSRLRSIGRLS